MRRFIPIAATIVIVLGILGGCLGLALASAAPFRPGNALFPLQHFAEEKRAELAFSNTGKAIYLLNLADRRSLDLVALSGTQDELVGLTAMDDALDHAETAMASAPDSDVEILQSRFIEVVEHAQGALLGLSIAPLESPEAFASAQAKVSILRELVVGSKVASDRALEKAKFLLMLPWVSTYNNPSLAGGLPLFDPLAISFPPGSPGAEHAFFPLVGAHSTLTCEGCHTNGQFAGTPNQCMDCHSPDRPANHYQGDCAACHNAFTWEDVRFDHAVANVHNCVSCHTDEKPANHFAGQCSACHSVIRWKPASFNHEAAGATNCQSCHNADKPANHYAGQCSACHGTRAWKPANFNHQAAGATNCQACHSDNKPANHFDGQCSDCHSTNSWKGAHFDHTGLTDCQSCHTRPANHTAGQ